MILDSRDDREPRRRSIEDRGTSRGDKERTLKRERPDDRNDRDKRRDDRKR